MKETNIDRKRIWRRKRKECRRIFGNEKKKNKRGKNRDKSLSISFVLKDPLDGQHPCIIGVIHLPVPEQ